MSEDNVIPFPKERIVAVRTQVVSPEQQVVIKTEPETDIALINHAYIHDVVETVLASMSLQLQQAGFKLGANTSLKDGAFLIEALHSFLKQQVEMKHPFQKVAEAIFEEQEDGDLRLVDNLVLCFTEDDNETA